MTEVVLALGANLGDQAANLRAAMAMLEERGVHAVRASSVWDTPPFPPDQPRYLNAVVVAETELGPEELLRLAKEVEWELGRRPGRRWGPRPADIDILFYGDERVETEDLVVPHPRIGERAFVLIPLAEVMPGRLPVLAKTAKDLLVGVDARGVERTEQRLDTGVAPSPED